MKTRANHRLILTAFVSLALLSGLIRLQAQGTNLTVNTFDDETSVAGFWSWWGGAQKDISWDSTMDASGSANSGSLKLTVTYDNTLSDNQYAIGMSLAGQSSYNGSLVAFPANYSALEFDLLWDSNSGFTADSFNTSPGDTGFNMGLAGVVATAGGAPDWNGGLISWISPSPTVTGDGKWHHISVPLALTQPGFAGLIFKKWQPTGSTGLNGAFTVWLDNLKLIGASAPPPPPKMTIERNTAHGVQIFASASNQYQRQSIAATSADAQALSWVGNSQPVTYALTIGDMPLNPNFQVQIFLSPDSGGANSPDWNDPNVIFLDIRRNADSTGFATFRYKTNAPNNNDMLYFQNGAPDGRLATLSTPSALGTWSIKFQNDTQISLSGPGNTSTNFTMPAANAELFRPASTMTASFGVQPNQTALIGQSATFTEVKITSGATTVLDDTFGTADPDQVVNPDLWTRRMDDPKGIAIVGANTPFVLSWTLPDTGYELLSSATLASNSWTVLPLTVTQVAGSKRATVAATNLPSLSRGFFQLKNTGSQ